MHIYIQRTQFTHIQRMLWFIASFIQRFSVMIYVFVRFDSWLKLNAIWICIQNILCVYRNKIHLVVIQASFSIDFFNVCHFIFRFGITMGTVLSTFVQKSSHKFFKQKKNKYVHAVIHFKRKTNLPNNTDCMGLPHSNTNKRKVK